MILCFDLWVREWCENEWNVLCCDVILRDKVVELRDLCLSKLYLIYMICISTCCFVSLLVRNVITHSPCIVCVWILWWSRTQMIRWIMLRNLVLKDVGTQCSNRMWHWNMCFYINCMKSWTTLFWTEMILLFIGQVILWC